MKLLPIVWYSPVLKILTESLTEIHMFILVNITLFFLLNLTFKIYYTCSHLSFRKQDLILGCPNVKGEK